MRRASRALELGGGSGAGAGVGVVMLVFSDWIDGEEARYAALRSRLIRLAHARHGVVARSCRRGGNAAAGNTFPHSGHGRSMSTESPRRDAVLHEKLLSAVPVAALDRGKM